MTTSNNVIEIYECYGQFSFLRQLHTFAFSIYNDNSLQVRIEPMAKAARSFAINHEGIDHELIERHVDYMEPIEDADQEDIDTSTEDSTAISNNDLQAQAEDEEIDSKVLAYDGRALVERPHAVMDGTTPSVCYVVHFKIVQWKQHIQGRRSKIVKCIAHLSRERGVSGRFVAIQDHAEEAQDFTLDLHNYRVELLENPLYPLTPGQYRFQGMTIAENAVVYGCIVDLTLQVNGMISGTSCELPFAQECPVVGMWTRNGLKYLLQYVMHGNKHTYIYVGTPSRSSLHGTWQHSELAALTRTLDIHTSEAERGILEFHLVKAVRVWSEAFHMDYPVSFRNCVKLMLLASYREGILLNHLWSSIVSYCGYNWFQSDSQVTDTTSDQQYQ